ncbi:MAG: cytochrome P450 [bacterium]|nr:cytochrome P450 [bacterium]
MDLLDPKSYDGGQPHEQFAWLREHDPVHRHAESDGGPGYWAITRYEDIRAISRNHPVFSNEPSIMIADPPADAPVTDDKMMLMCDPPYQTQLRRIVSGAFTPKAARALKPRVERLATQIVDEVIERGECDFVADVAGELPSYVIAELLGLPLDDGRKLYQLTETIHSSTDAVGQDAQVAAGIEMFSYAARVAAEKRANPGDDLATQLLHAEVDGHRLSDMEFNLFFMLLVDAGGDTTRNLVAGGMLALLERPDELARLRGDLDRVLPTAREELLRFTSPVVYMRRTAKQDTEVAGRPIRAGDKLVLYYGSANRDRSVFDEPDRLDVTRTPNHHVAFGATGAHFCLGAQLARVEIDAMLREVLTRMPDLELAGEASWLPSNFISGPRAMPVRFTPGARSAGGDRGRS